jgi:hypothetical protein
MSAGWSLVGLMTRRSRSGQSFLPSLTLCLLVSSLLVSGQVRTPDDRDWDWLREHRSEAFERLFRHILIEVASSLIRIRRFDTKLLSPREPW